MDTNFTDYIIGLINYVLTYTDRSPVPENVFRLMLGTGMVESKYRHTRQTGGGPARGWWQVEPATAEWVVGKNKFRFFHKELYGIHLQLPIENKRFLDRLQHDQVFNLLVARVRYKLIPAPIPESLPDLAAYWTRYYNTRPGTEIKFIHDWNGNDCDDIVTRWKEI